MGSSILRWRSSRRMFHLFVRCMGRSVEDTTRGRNASLRVRWSDTVYAGVRCYGEVVSFPVSTNTLATVRRVARHQSWLIIPSFRLVVSVQPGLRDSGLGRRPNIWRFLQLVVAVCYLHPGSAMKLES